MPVIKQFNQLDPINNGTTAQDNFKLSDAIPAQHTDLASGVNKLVHRTFAQSLCEPVAVCNSNNPQNGAYVATCLNYPDFALSYQDAQQNTQYFHLRYYLWFCIERNLPYIEHQWKRCYSYARTGQDNGNRFCICWTGP